MKFEIQQPSKKVASKLRESEIKQISESLNQLVDSVMLDRVAILARRGDLKQAEEILTPIAEDADAPTYVLDLLAKIYAQQRKIKEAQNLWLRALNIEPSNRHFLRALLRCADFMKENGGYL
jgi:tetratricopeptide (TPR) repeat protein